MTAPLITRALVEAATLGTGHVVVDVSGTRFWDCSGLHALADFTADLAAAGRACRIVGATPATRRLLSAASLTDQLELDGPLDAGTTPPLAAGNFAEGSAPHRPAVRLRPARRAGPCPRRRGGAGPRRGSRGGARPTWCRGSAGSPGRCPA